jgi:hypothetical protein
VQEDSVSIVDVLRSINFGERVAEEEGDQLAAYFVETDHWRRLFADQVDVIYGPKGSGKSALYFLLIARRSDLFDRGILIVPAENPRGTPAFSSLVIDPPATEREFIALWKLYLACIISATLEEYGISNRAASLLREHLERGGLRLRQTSLQSIVQSVLDYVKRILRPTAVEGDIKLDPITQQPIGVSGKIIFSEPTPAQVDNGFTSVDNLLKLGHEALSAAEYKLWILLDRLDVAFSESSALEHNALRALFHVYLDLLAFNSLRLKVFLRTDIWRRITTSGFREASHITRHLTIEWNKGTLLNLVIRRAVQNERILLYYGDSNTHVLSTPDNQMKFFYCIFPEQVEVGPNKPTTLDWMLSRTRDSSGQTAPRELIHLLNSLRNVQVRRLEIGEIEPEGRRLFSRAVFKEALPEVSRTRLEQTLYAEYPDARTYIEQLRGEKTQQSINTLSNIWKLKADKTMPTARHLVEIGFFEERGMKDNPEFWVPFLYRDALDLIQGAAE